MKTFWTKLENSFESKTLREKIVIASLILAVIYGLFDLFLLMPQIKEKEKIKAQLTKVQSEMKKVTAQEKVFAMALTNDPQAKNKQKIRELELKLANVEVSLANLSAGLIPASELPQALHDVVQSVGSLTLIGVQTKKPTKLTLKQGVIESKPTPSPTPDTTLDNSELIEKYMITGEVAEGAPSPMPEPEKVGVYKHSVIVEIKGEYFDVIAYLDALEALPWKIYWQGLDYEVANYPKAKVVLEVYTLSTEEGVLGV